MVAKFLRIRLMGSKSASAIEHDSMSAMTARSEGECRNERDFPPANRDVAIHSTAFHSDHDWYCLGIIGLRGNARLDTVSAGVARRIMGEFFHGWRRKVGVGLLAAASLLAILWMRSWYVVDEVFISPPFPPARRIYKTLGSQQGNISWLEWTTDGGAAVVSETSYTTYSSRKVTYSDHLDIPNPEIKRFDWRFKCWLIDIGSTDVDDEFGVFGYRHSTHIIIPYNLPVLLLTLLSACLLLWKPRKKAAP